MYEFLITTAKKRLVHAFENLLDGCDKQLTKTYISGCTPAFYWQKSRGIYSLGRVRKKEKLSRDKKACVAGVERSRG